MSKKITKKSDTKYDDTLVGYARVSTEDQSLDMQIAALEAAGVRPERIMTEKVSGVAKKRPGRDLALKLCRPGDTFVVWKFDRVGRSVLDLLMFIEKLRSSGVEFRSLREQIDTTSPVGQAMLTLSGVFAQLERDLIAERTKAGVERAKARGVKFGQPKKFAADGPEVASMRRMLSEGMSVARVAKAFSVAPATIRNYIPTSEIQKLRPKS